MEIVENESFKILFVKKSQFNDFHIGINFHVI